MNFIDGVNMIKTDDIEIIKTEELFMDFIKWIIKIETKIDKLEKNSNELKKLVKNFAKMDKIEKELVKDFIEQIIKIEEEKDFNKWKNKLKD